MGLLNISQAGLVAIWGDTAGGNGTLPPGLGNVKAIAGGGSHSLALKSDGTVAAWGRLDSRNADAVKVPAGLSGVVAVSAGDNHSVALTVSGNVVAWGNNLEGQTNVPAGLSKVTAIAAGPAHNLALRSDGTVVAWGWNVAGQATVPSGLTDVKAIAAGGSSLALKQDGTVLAWGQTSYGLTDVPAGLSNVTAIAAGGYFNLALKADGTIAAWGSNDEGQNDVPPSATNVVAIAAGFAHGVALRSDGVVIVWGRNIFGQQIVPSGLAQVTAIAAGANYNLALTFAGPVQILQGPQSQAVPYGSNTTFAVTATGYEPLGYQWFFNGAAIDPANPRINGTTNSSMTISSLDFSDIGTYTVLVSNAFGSVMSTGAVLAVGNPPLFTSYSATNQTVRAGTNLTLSAAVSGTAPLAYQWLLNGTNLAGQTSPALSLFNLQPSASGIYSMLAANLYGNVRVDISLTVTDSAPYFVRQPFVQLPDQSSTTNPVVPLGGSITINVGVLGSTPLTYQWRFQGAHIPGGTNATLLLANMLANQAGFYNLEVRNAFGSAVSAKIFVSVVPVYMWETKTLTPLNVPTNLTDVVSVAAGSSLALALKSDGRVVSWSASPAGIITNVPSSVTNVAAIVAKGVCSMALRSNGTVVVWGSVFNQTNTPSGATNMMAIAVGEANCLALRSNGTVLAWGSGTTTIPPGLSNVIAIGAGSSHNLALKTDGRVVAWGGTYGQTTNIIAGLSNVIAIDAAGNTSVALRDDGRVFSWNSGSVPVVAPLSNVVGVVAGLSRNFAIKSDGSLVSWFNGQTLNTIALTNVIAVANNDRGGFALAALGNGAPAFTVHPASRVVAPGDTVRLQARTAGLLPTTYQWQFQGMNLPNATNTSLVITAVQGKDIGAYRCVASNARGTSTSNPALLSFLPYTGTLPQALNATNLTWVTNFSNAGPSLPPWFAQNQETHGDDAAAQSGAITDGGQSILGTTVTGPGTLTFWWRVSSEEGYDFLSYYFDNLQIPVQRLSGESGWLQVTQAVAAGTHTLRWIYSKDVTVSAGRDAGWLDQVTFTSELPKIVRHPFNKVATLGDTVTIPAVAESSLPITFQWLKNGTNLPGATAQYLTLTNVTRDDAATYALRVSNAYGSVTSSNATLTVLVPQLLGSIQPLEGGGLELFSRDANGGLLASGNLPAFEAQASEDLFNWVTLTNCLSVTNGALRLRDPEGTIHPQRFYRILER